MTVSFEPLAFVTLSVSIAGLTFYYFANRAATQRASIHDRIKADRDETLRRFGESQLRALMSMDVAVKKAKKYEMALYLIVDECETAAQCWEVASDALSDHDEPMK